MARGRWGWSPHIKGSRQLIEKEQEKTMAKRTPEQTLEKANLDHAWAEARRLRETNADLLAALEGLWMFISEERIELHIRLDGRLVELELESLMTNASNAIERAHANEG